MLQQTRVETVIPYFERFLARFPTTFALAEAPLDEVLSHWSGLGYYRRARMMHAAAKQVVAERDGQFPSDAASLERIQGIGRYTAGAVASIAYGEAVPLVDGNVMRVLARWFALTDDVTSTSGKKRMWSLAEELVSSRAPGDWNQALMELGAMVCVPREPRCLLCPVARSCAARAQGLERDLPRLASKKPPRVQRRVAFVVERDGRLLLGRRKDELLNGGMWEPPSIDVLGDGDSPRGSAFGLDRAACERVARVEHVLTHRRLLVDVFRAHVSRHKLPRPNEVYEAFEYVDASQLGGRGMTTLARKILQAAHVALR